jgi:hypothetical protein
MSSTTYGQYSAAQGQWLVGLRLHAGESAVTWHYYVVGDPDPGRAVDTAIKRAGDPRQLVADPAPRIADLEIRRLRHHRLGHIYLDPDEDASVRNLLAETRRILEGAGCRPQGVGAPDDDESPWRPAEEPGRRSDALALSMC